MPISKNPNDTSGPSETFSTGAATPTRKRPDPILGRQPDSFTAIGHVDQTIGKRLDKFEKGGRNGKSGV